MDYLIPLTDSRREYYSYFELWSKKLAVVLLLGYEFVNRGEDLEEINAWEIPKDTMPIPDDYDPQRPDCILSDLLESALSSGRLKSYDLGSGGTPLQKGTNPSELLNWARGNRLCQKNLDLSLWDDSLF